MARDTSSRALLGLLDEALAMLRTQMDTDADSAVVADSLPSLLEQCEAASAEIAGPEPLRSIHHFACTGGSVMAKALFALPNTVVLSEIDPLSTLMLTTGDKVPFAPTDLIFALRHSVRPVEDEILVTSFLAGLTAAKAGLEKGGRHLVLRDHAHSQFCQDSVDFDARMSVHEMMADCFDLRSIVTMRHPLDSFLSLAANGWVHFSPGTLEEYGRRYLAFLDRHDGLPILLYEDFTDDPDAVLRRMCDHLELAYSPLAIDLIGAVRVSGDSGRRDTKIGPRPRREVPAEIEAQRNTSASYRVLCDRFGYDP